MATSSDATRRSTARRSTEYDPRPRYAPAAGRVERGWDAAAKTLTDADAIIALDGPQVLDWDAAISALTAALARRGIAARHIAMGDYFAPWEEIVARTATAELADDPDFARLARGDLADLFQRVPRARRVADGKLIVFGPGAALATHDVLWYADLPKRFAEQAVADGTGRNLGLPPGGGPSTSRRLFFIDWPLLDRHRESVAPAIDRWFDAQDPGNPASLDGASLRLTAGELARRPFRTRPTFKTAPWGGHWGQRTLGLNTEAANTAIGYELIAPESGVLVGESEAAEVEIPFQFIVAHSPAEVLGSEVLATFGKSFPVRFDYLDTVAGGNLSIHCHPRADYMSRVFGWPYTQHESYYVMVGGEGAKVFLGLRDDVDLAAFEQAARAAAEQGRSFHVDDHVQHFPAEAHRLFMIPAGTPHGSGAGNVVLEMSATPYLYSLRFYDWLRQDVDGTRRPVHVDHAFANLDPDRSGKRVPEDLIQPPRMIRSGAGWQEELIGALAGVFFELHRIVLNGDEPAPDDTNGRFHVLNVVEGGGAEIATATGHAHVLNYAETIVIPAAVGPYTVRRMSTGRVRIVKAFVR